MVNLQVWYLIFVTLRQLHLHSLFLWEVMTRKLHLHLQKDYRTELYYFELFSVIPVLWLPNQLVSGIN